MPKNFFSVLMTAYMLLAVGSSLNVRFSDAQSIQSASVLMSATNIAGDVNGDGVVNYSDLVAILNHLSGRVPLSQDAISRADANSDGVVDTNDRATARRILDNSIIQKLSLNATGQTTVSSAQPSIILSASDTNGKAPLTVDFKLIYRNMSNCSGYLVDYGDGTGAASMPECATSTIVSEQTVGFQHTYRSNGTYIAKVSSGEYNSKISITVAPVTASNYGDLNADNSVTSADVILLRRFVLNLQTPTEQQRANSDLDKSGKIDDADVLILRLRVVDLIRTLPLKPVLFGDINEDGSVNIADLVLVRRFVVNAQTPTDQQRVSADVDMDGRVNDTDVLIMRLRTVNLISTLPLQPVVFGDINADGSVNIADLVLVRRFVVNAQTPTDQQRVSADVDMDGRVNDTDVMILRLRTVGLVTTLPLKPVVYGDLNGDSNVTSADVTIMTNIILGNQTATEQQRVNGDVNLDGQLTSADTSLMRQFVLQTIPALPVPVTQ